MSTIWSFFRRGDVEKEIEGKISLHTHSFLSAILRLLFNSSTNKHIFNIVHTRRNQLADSPKCYITLKIIYTF